MIFGKKKNCHRQGICQNTACPECINLNSALEDCEYIINCNHHRKSFELGLFRGNRVRIISNSYFQKNMIVGVGDSRYIISRDVAKTITVQEVNNY